MHYKHFYLISFHFCRIYLIISLRDNMLGYKVIYTGLVSTKASLTSWEVASLALIGNPSSSGVTIKMPYAQMFYTDQLCTPSFPIGLVKIESGFVRSVETGSGR